MNRIAIQYYPTPCGELILGAFEGHLCLCDWRHRQKREAIDTRLTKALNAAFVLAENDVLKATVGQLGQYFAGQRQQFDLPLRWVGTPFQQTVWQQLMHIPYGQTDTYLGLSKKLGNVLAIRAVASANGANAISIIVPCHRVVGSNDELIGYAGGLEAKQKLLTLENKQFGQKNTAQMSLF